MRIIISFLCLIFVLISNMHPTFSNEMTNIKKLQIGGTSSFTFKRQIILFTIFILMFIYRLYSDILNEITLLEIILAISVWLFALIRIWCYLALGNMFTFKLMIKNNHELITTGPYKYLVHPSYTAQIGVILSYILFMKCYYLIPIFIITLKSLPSRMRSEEILMHNEFGIKYDIYLKQRWKMVPFVY